MLYITILFIWSIATARKKRQNGCWATKWSSVEYNENEKQKGLNPDVRIRLGKPIACYKVTVYKHHSVDLEFNALPVKDIFFSFFCCKSQTNREIWCNFMTEFRFFFILYDSFCVFFAVLQPILFSPNLLLCWIEQSILQHHYHGYLNGFPFTVL